MAILNENILVRNENTPKDQKKAESFCVFHATEIKKAKTNINSIFTISNNLCIISVLNLINDPSILPLFYTCSRIS